MRLNLAARLSRFARGFGRRKHKRRAAPEPVYFSDLKRLSDEEWRAALAESPGKAARWVYAAATYGDIDAQLYWAQMLLDGCGTTRDTDAAFRWFGIAAKSRRPDAVNMLGRCYERGWGVAADLAQAAACYQDAADKGLDWAQFNLACLLLDGRGVAPDPTRAFDLFMQAAAQGNAKATTMIGRFHEHGWGRPPDLAAAAEWYRRGAEDGDFRGQYHCGRLLLVRGRRDEALPWLRRAIERAPAGFCREVANELLRHPDPRLHEIGRHAQVRSGSLERIQIIDIAR